MHRRVGRHAAACGHLEQVSGRWKCAEGFGGAQDRVYKTSQGTFLWTYVVLDFEMYVTVQQDFFEMCNNYRQCA